MFAFKCSQDEAIVNLNHWFVVHQVLLENNFVVISSMKKALYFLSTALLKLSSLVAVVNFHVVFLYSCSVTHVIATCFFFNWLLLLA